MKKLAPLPTWVSFKDSKPKCVGLLCPFKKERVQGFKIPCVTKLWKNKQIGSYSNINYFTRHKFQVIQIGATFPPYCRSQLAHGLWIWIIIIIISWGNELRLWIKLLSGLQTGLGFYFILQCWHLKSLKVSVWSKFKHKKGPNKTLFSNGRFTYPSFFNFLKKKVSKFQK